MSECWVHIDTGNPSSRTRGNGGEQRGMVEQSTDGERWSEQTRANQVVALIPESWLPRHQAPKRSNS